MDFRTPCQIFLGVLLAAVALSVLGLSADSISYVNRSSDNSVDIHYTRWNETAHAQYSYWVNMDYEPSKFSMGTMDAMIVASVISVLAGLGASIVSWTARGKRAIPTSFRFKKQNERCLPLLPTALVLTIITFLVSLAVAIYVGHPISSLPEAFQNSLPLPPHTSAADQAGSALYQSTYLFTPEVWNCFLAPYVVDPTQSRKLQGLCRETQTARYLMIPLLILSAGLLCCLLWTWRQARLTAASDAENVNGKEIEEISIQSKE